MIDSSHQPVDLGDARWKAVRLGLRLANSYLGVGLIGWFYALWALFGLVLCLAFIPIAIMGKEDAFKSWLNPVALYGLAVPMAVLAAATWAAKLFSRLLWCATPEPMLATLLAFAAVTGRLCVSVGVAYLWLRGGPWRKGLLVPDVVACAGTAWLGLVAEWGFIRALQHEFFPTANPDYSSSLTVDAGKDLTNDEHLTKPPTGSILRRDLGEWFKSRFPTGYKLVVWIFLPVGYVAVSSLANDGDPRAVPEAILRLAVVAPVILQTFWIPNDKLHGLIEALSPAAVVKQPR